MKATGINKPATCSPAATRSCGCCCLLLLQLVFVVRDVGLHALLGQQLPPGLEPLAAGTVGGLEAGLVVAGFALCRERGRAAESCGLAEADPGWLALHALQACPGRRCNPLPASPQYLTFTRPALVELKGEDDVVFVLAELTDEAFSLAQLEEKVREKWLNAPHLPGKPDRR